MFKNTVDNVLVEFQKTLDKLSAINQQASEEAEKFARRAKDMEEKRDAAKAEAERATSVYNKISALIR